MSHSRCPARSARHGRRKLSLRSQIHITIDENGRPRRVVAGDRLDESALVYSIDRSARAILSAANRWPGLINEDTVPELTAAPSTVWVYQGSDGAMLASATRVPGGAAISTSGGDWPALGQFAAGPMDVEAYGGYQSVAGRLEGATPRRRDRFVSLGDDGWGTLASGASFTDVSHLVDPIPVGFGLKGGQARVALAGTMGLSASTSDIDRVQFLEAPSEYGYDGGRADVDAAWGRHERDDDEWHDADHEWGVCASYWDEHAVASAARRSLRGRDITLNEALLIPDPYDPSRTLLVASDRARQDMRDGVVRPASPMEADDGRGGRVAARCLRFAAQLSDSHSDVTLDLGVDELVKVDDFNLSLQLQRAVDAGCGREYGLLVQRYVENAPSADPLDMRDELVSDFTFDDESFAPLEEERQQREREEEDAWVRRFHGAADGRTDAERRREEALDALDEAFVVDHQLTRVRMPPIPRLEEE